MSNFAVYFLDNRKWTFNKKYLGTLGKRFVFHRRNTGGKRQFLGLIWRILLKDFLLIC